MLSSPQACRRAACSLIALALIGWLILVTPGAAAQDSDPCLVVDCTTTTEPPPSTEPEPEPDPEPTTPSTSEAIVQQTTTSAHRTPITQSRAQAPETTDAPTTTEPASTTTERDLLVAGDGSDGAESTTTTAETSVVKASEAVAGGLSETSAVWAIVGGLVAVALGIGWWTWRFWRKTAPRPATTAQANARVEQPRRGPNTKMAPPTAPASSNGAGKKAGPRRVVAKKAAAPGRSVAAKAAPRKAAPRLAVKKAAPRRPGGPIDGDGSPAFRSGRR